MRTLGRITPTGNALHFILSVTVEIWGYKTCRRIVRVVRDVRCKMQRFLVNGLSEQCRFDLISWHIFQQ